MTAAPTRRAAAVAALGAVALVAALGFGTAALVPLAVGLLAAPAAAVAVVVACRRGITVTRGVEPRRLTAGEGFLVRVTLAGWPVRTGLVRVLDRRVGAGVPGRAGPAARAGTVARGARRRGEVEVGWSVAPARRGVHVLGPPQVTLSDPFGLAVAGARGASPDARILVGPRTVAVSHAIAAGDDDGAAAGAGRHRHLAGLEVDGVRDYRPGDPLSRVHWAQSARRGRLQTKEMRAPTGGDHATAVLLDCRADPAADPAAFETAVAAAASVARALLGNARAVTVVHSGSGPQAAGARSYDDVEACLAGVAADGEAGAAALIDGQLRARPAPGAVLVATAAADPGLAASARRARASGMHVTCVLCGPACALDAEVRAAGARTVLVPAADALGRALSGGGRGARA